MGVGSREGGEGETVRREEEKRGQRMRPFDRPQNRTEC